MIVEYAQRIIPPSDDSPGDQCRRRARVTERSALRNLVRAVPGSPLYRDDLARVRRDRVEARRLRDLAMELDFQSDWQSATPTERRHIVGGCY